MAAPKGNQYALGNKGGRPLKIKSLEELQEKIEYFFNDSDSYAYVEDDEGIKRYKPTITGLALQLNVDRETITNYQDREEYFDTIKGARSRVELFLEQRLFLNNPTGTIFNLKNNFGWTDKQQLDHQSSDGSMTPKSYAPEQYKEAADNLEGKLKDLDD